MHYPQTMALEINETTYDIAVACLPAGFARIDKENVLGHMLVINELQVKSFFRDQSDRPSEFRIGNAHMRKKHFEKLYRYTTPGKKGNTFSPIESID